MQRYRTTIIMGGALIILAVLAIFLTRNNSATLGVPTPTPLTYVWEEANPVSAISVMSGTEKVSLKKDPTLGTWTITEPVSKPADLFAVSGVADSLQKLQAQFSLTGTTDLEQYGLGANPMVVSVTLSDTQGTKQSLDVGRSTPDGSGYYVKKSDSGDVYVVQNTTIEPLRTWLTTPPVEQPTATPLPITVGPQASATPTASGSETTIPESTPSALATGTAVSESTPAEASPTTGEATTPVETATP
ncbi:MAG: DUF4340 domain-containing protein [Chloroflexota bacterium]